MAAGDIVCVPTARVTSSTCRHKATSDILVANNPTYVLPLGDLQYERGELANFRRSYDPTWGRMKSRTRPVPGNHEYATAGAAGYYDYFGSAAGNRGAGYYSFKTGHWHVIALNSSIARHSTSAQVKWLRNDLTRYPRKCTLVYWHSPRFSSGEHGSDTSVTPFWQVLYSANADVILNGHEHNYERFAPQNPSGALDWNRGIRQFVVGTGGKSQRPFSTVKPNSQVRHTGTYGVLKLDLHSAGYHWRFIPEAGRSFSDSGWAPCH